MEVYGEIIIALSLVKTLNWSQRKFIFYMYNQNLVYYATTSI